MRSLLLLLAAPLTVACTRDTPDEPPSPAARVAPAESPSSFCRRDVPPPGSEDDALVSRALGACCRKGARGLTFAVGRSYDRQVFVSGQNLPPEFTECMRGRLGGWWPAPDVTLELEIPNCWPAPTAEPTAPSLPPAVPSAGGPMARVQRAVAACCPGGSRTLRVSFARRADGRLDVPVESGPPGFADCARERLGDWLPPDEGLTIFATHCW